MQSSRVLFICLILLTVIVFASCGGSSTGDETGSSSPGSGGGSASVPEDFELGVLPYRFPDLEVNQGVSVALEGRGGIAPYSWVVANGSLPDWLSMSLEGVLTGEPTSTDTATFTIECTDALGKTGQRQYSFAPDDNSGSLVTPETTSSYLSLGSVGSSYSFTLSGVGGRLPYEWSVTNGTLPTGLSLDGTAGSISGIPTASSVSSVEITITDATLQTTSKTFNAVVNDGSEFPHRSDFNGDGYDDFIVGARLNDQGNTDA